MKRSFVLLGVGGLLGATLTLVPTVGHGRDRPKTSDDTTAVVTPPPLSTPAPVPPPAGEHAIPTYDPSHSFAPLVQSIAPAVLQIEVEGTTPAPDLSQIPPQFRQFLGIDPRSMQPQVRKGEGSGFIVSADGLVLTNNHVIEGADDITARFADGTTLKAKVLGADPSLDIALLRLDGDNKAWPYVQLGESNDLQVGDWVVAVGNPLGLGTTVTAGIISGKGRALGHDAWDDFIQTDAAINEGNSGGPLFNLDGKVVGINTAIIAGANTIGFAIPIDMARDIMDDLEKNGHVARGYIGVQSADDDGDGAVVADVVTGTPAAKAGLLVGDRILKVDDKAVADPTDLVRAIGLHAPGDKVSLDVQRGSKSINVDVTLEERPDEQALARSAEGGGDEGPGDQANDNTVKLGAKLEGLSGDDAKDLGVTGGVKVDEIEQGSHADGYLRPGDVIIEVNHWPVETPAQVKTLLERAKGNALLLVIRDGGRRFVAVPLK